MIEERREYQRVNVGLGMRVYTSIKAGAYSVKVTDISTGGAFIETKHLPNLSEIISFELVDESLRPIHFGNATVMRLKNGINHAVSGFGVKFSTDLDDSLLKSLRLTQ